MSRTHRSVRRATGRAAPALAVAMAITVLSPAGASAFTVESEVDDTAAFVSSEGCGSMDDVTYDLDRVAFDVRPIQPNVGDTLSSPSGVPVARVADVEVKAQSVVFRAVAIGAVCSTPSVYPSGWETAEVRFQVSYSVRPLLFLPSSCRNQVQKPRRIFITCGVGNFILTNLKWRGWGERTARARGSALTNDCRPDCAHGNFTRTAVAVTASNPRHCSATGDYQYKRVSWRFLGKTPRGVRSGSRSFWRLSCPG